MITTRNKALEWVRPITVVFAAGAAALQLADEPMIAAMCAVTAIILAAAWVWIEIFCNEG